MLHGLTIVDTPVDTPGLRENGKESHKKLVDQIEHFFKNEHDTIDAIFFIVHSPGRLSREMNSILRFFWQGCGNELVHDRDQCRS